LRGYLHGFNNSLEVAEHFSRFDLAFSFGCKPPKPKVIRYITKRGLYLFETDTPYQKAISDKAEFNHLKNLPNCVEHIGKVSSTSLKDLIYRQQITFDQIFPEPELFRK